MDRTERFYKIDQLLQERRVVPMEMLIDKLGVSHATVKRDLEYLRDRLNAPIVWDREFRGYRYDTPQEDSPRYSLPGLWFNATEVHALLTMEYLLSNIQPGLLGPHIAPLRTRIRLLLESGDHSASEVARRIRFLHMAARPVEPGHFQAISSALLRRRRLRIHHYNRKIDEVIERDVSPQRLVYYRDNWYLDAWCHLRKGLRSFGLNAIRATGPLMQKAREIPDHTLDTELGAGYGIFAGRRTKKATLRFAAERARWVAAEVWHPEQKNYFDEQGRYVLVFEYSNDTELIMDILRYGPDVEVLKPLSLRRKIRDSLRLAQNVYSD